jgi:two-component system, NtrC family, sensor histidine kinase HydH
VTVDAVTERRADVLFHELLDANYRRTSRMFIALMVGQWLFGIGIALLISPRTWEGKVNTVHVHVLAAVVLGALISSLPIFLLLTAPAATSTRMIVASAQMLWSALLIHLTGGRIETHFHVFGSLAFVAFYRDWRVLVPATIVVAADHLARGIFWPESVYGVLNPEWWRFLEHAGWVAFEDVVLIFACIRGVEETQRVAHQQAVAEALSHSERDKAVALAAANEELMRSRDAMKKLAEVGELAASVGHELRNPMAAVRNGLAYISKRVLDPNIAGPALAQDARVKQFLDLMDKELQGSSRIVADLLDFARERPPDLRQCPLGPLVDEAIALVPARAHVKLVNEVPHDLPIPQLDKDQFRQALINLIQNAAEAIPPERTGQVVVRSVGGGSSPWRITVADDGVGIPDEIVGRIFQPLFTTKTKGTGLGLAIVAGMVQRHGGTIQVDSRVGQGSTFAIELPATQVMAAGVS